GIGTYKVFRGLASAPDAAMTQVATVFASPYRDTTASVGVLFKYGLKSSTEAGDTAMSTIDTGYRGIGAPATVRASNGTFSDRVEVSWTAVPGSTAYKLYRGTAGTPAGAPLVTTSDLSYVDTTGTAGVLYAYSVVCDTPAGPSRSSTTAGGWRNVSPPSDVAASDGTFSDRVRVTWTPIVATPKYAVYRRLGTQSATRLGVVTGTSFDDRTARPGTLYTYMVRSVVVPGESRDSLPNNGWRLNPNGPNPDTPGGGSGGGMPRLASVDPAGFGGGSSAAFVGGGAGSIERGGDIDGGIPSEDPLMRRIEPSDPAWQLDCTHATREELAAALERGSRDSDADGEPDLCQRERGDLDLNGRVDAGDIVLLLLLVGESDPVMGDFDHDGCVDRADLDMLQDLVTAQQALDDLEAELEAPGMPGAPSRD
ncbi:MAG: hypothetical protein EBU70_12990, partial [Actinobacteria bacterium]|nr:hypothetical protein [Actinomycetota bacterium]